ncbi:MAG TPA: SDR family oxidoreductase [Thermoanaerobaculia bacterium]|jgi:NAD(P)-dependent dehydrogenase (short-subunit alcohol dehydrogenase family)|nr:SDR family oxidoreductase [Thermoanaerobaculia bacterium]
MLTIDLTSKVILITGASRGIGREAALLLAEAGASVGVNYFRGASEAEDVVRTIGSDRALAVQADMASPADVEAMIDAVVARFGRLDVLVNNAAVFDLNPFDGDDYEAWRRGWEKTFAINVFGAANAAFLAMRPMRRQGGGKIINIASRAAYRGETEFADYGASKAALVNLTISIARGCAKDNITSTCIAPGFIETDMAKGEIDKQRQAILEQIPLRRIGLPADVAGTVLFLASPLADYLNGATIDVNGGSWFH